MTLKITFGPRKVVRAGKRGALIYVPTKLTNKLVGKTVIVTVEVIDEK